VKGNFARFNLPTERRNIQLVRGLFQDTMRITQPVALPHIDGDWYESVMACVSRIAPMLIKGGVLVIDDYKAWSVCRRAIDEYFAERRHEFEFQERSRLHIVRR
jgi:asparagine synthase (glutamine-hydrolysing)